MNKAPAFQLYAADFYMDTLTWEAEDIGVYFCLLMAEWVNGPLENDNKKLAKIAKKTTQKFNKNWSKISHKFYLNPEGFLINLRLEDERRKQEKYSESQKDRANKRWGKDDAGAYPTAIPAHMPAHIPDGCSSSSSSSSKDIITSNNDHLFVDNSLPEPLPEDTPLETTLLKKENEKPLSKNTHGERWTEKQGSELEILMPEIKDRYGDKYHQQCYIWLQAHFNRANPDAVLYCLRRLIQERLAGKQIPAPGRWLEAVIAVENAKAEARESEQEHQAHKAEETRDVAKLISGIGIMPRGV